MIPLAFRLTGTLNQTALRQSIQALVQRHESLRTSLISVEGQLMQIVTPELAVTLELIRLDDAADLPEPGLREQKALQQIWQAIQQPFQLDRAPLFRVQLWQLQDREHLLLLTLHHSILDEWSSGVLIRELGQLYGALAASKPASKLTSKLTSKPTSKPAAKPSDLPELPEPPELLNLPDLPI